MAWFYSRPLDGTTPATLVARDSVMILSGSDYEVGFLARVRSAGWRGPILEYIDTAYAMGPASAADGSCPAGFDGMTIQPAWNLNTFCDRVNPHEDWFLHNGAGKRIYSSIDSSSSYYLMNPASPGWRAFVAAQVKDALFGTNGRPPLYHMDGVFLDDVWGTANAPRNREDDSDGTCRECGTEAQWLSGYVGFLQAVKAAAGKRPVWINSDNSTTLTRPVDGLMIENMGASWGTSYMSQSEIERRWRDVDALTAAHKSVLLVGQGNARSDVERMRFAHAVYLMVAGPQVSFRFQNADDYRSFWDYPEYHLALGAPAGPRYRVGASTWRRDFAVGTAIVNLSATRSQTVHLGHVYRLPGGGTADTVTLGPEHGLALVRS